MRTPTPRWTYLRSNRSSTLVFNSSSPLPLTLPYVPAEENDTVLIPSPYYAAFSNDLGVRAKLNLKGIDCGGIIGVDGLEESYDYRVKIVLITNPHNPTGRIYSVEELKEIVEWCRRRKVHLIVDEIYCMSVFKGERVL